MTTVTTDEAKLVIPRNIERALSAKGWTRYRLALACGISHATMHNICTGVHDPKASNLKSIADALDISVDELLQEEFQKKEKRRRKTA